jgi:class 3 adenylate cyclase
LALVHLNNAIDVAHLLSTITLPTLILHLAGDPPVNVEHSRNLAVRAAKCGELPGNDNMPWAGDIDALRDEIQAFLTGARNGPGPERVLATVLFTDIVDATERAADMGDRAWKELLCQHHVLVRQQLEHHRGREIDTAGDGFLATFDGPARAVRCARAIADAVKELNIQVRAGVHTGECEVMGGKLSGIAIHIGARVMSLAMPDEVMVSSTVRDLVTGSGLRFESRGAHSLKGIPGEWHLHAAIS